MALSLASISCKAQLRAPRGLLLGVEKIGKTTFACGCRIGPNGELLEQGVNSPILLPIKGEEGADDLEVPSFPTINTFDELMEAIGVLYSEEHPYKTVVIDSASALEPIVWDHLCQRAGVSGIEKVGGGYGKGYIEAASCFRQILDGLDALRGAKNMASFLIGHVKVKRFDDPEGDSYDRYQFDVHDRTANLVYRWADTILFAGTKVVTVAEDVGFNKDRKRGVDISGGSRFLFTQKRPAHPGGGRGAYGRLPYELPLDWTAFQTAVSNAYGKEK